MCKEKTNADLRLGECRWTLHFRWSNSRRSTATSAASQPAGWTASSRRCCPAKSAGSRRACRSICAAAARSGLPRTRACRWCSSAPAQASLHSGEHLVVANDNLTRERTACRQGLDRLRSRLTMDQGAGMTSSHLGVELHCGDLQLCFIAREQHDIPLQGLPAAAAAAGAVRRVAGRVVALLRLSRAAGGLPVP